MKEGETIQGEYGRVGVRMGQKKSWTENCENCSSKRVGKRQRWEGGRNKDEREIKKSQLGGKRE